MATPKPRPNPRSLPDGAGRGQDQPSPKGDARLGTHEQPVPRQGDDERSRPSPPDSVND